MSDTLITSLMIAMIMEMTWTAISFRQIKKELEAIKKTNLYLAELLGDRQDLEKAFKEHDETILWDVQKRLLETKDDDA